MADEYLGSTLDPRLSSFLSLSKVQIERINTNTDYILNRLPGWDGKSIQ